MLTSRPDSLFTGFSSCTYFCFRILYDSVFHPVRVNVGGTQRAVDTELKGQRATVVEEHLKIHLFEDFGNAWDVPSCLGHREKPTTNGEVQRLHLLCNQRERAKTEPLPCDRRELWEFSVFSDWTGPIIDIKTTALPFSCSPSRLLSRFP